MTRGPAPKITEVLVDIVTMHTEVSQVGKGGELVRGRDIMQLIGATVLGTKYDNTSKIDSFWRSCGRNIQSNCRQGQRVPWKTQDQNGQL